MDAVTEPENRYGFISTPNLMKTLNKDEYRYGVSSIFVADVDITPMWFGYTMKPLVKEIISTKAAHLQEAGILSYKINSAFMKDFETKPEEIGPQVLSLQHLEAGFVVILCLLGFSVAVFAVEVAPKLLKMLLLWSEKAVFCCVVVKFTRMNKLM
jgi:hypothetical protein